MNELPLTRRQQEMFDWIVAQITREGRAPTVREIGKQCGITSPNGVLCHVKALEKKGYLVRDWGKARSLVLTGKGLLAPAACVEGGQVEVSLRGPSVRLLRPEQAIELAEQLLVAAREAIRSRKAS
jgi:repressor LexA